jgi:hypothetical protein
MPLHKSNQHENYSYANAQLNAQHQQQEKNTIYLKTVFSILAPLKTTAPVPCQLCTGAELST